MLVLGLLRVQQAQALVFLEGNDHRYRPAFLFQDERRLQISDSRAVLDGGFCNLLHLQTSEPPLVFFRTRFMPVARYITPPTSPVATVMLYTPNDSATAVGAGTPTCPNRPT